MRLPSAFSSARGRQLDGAVRREFRHFGAGSTELYIEHGLAPHAAMLIEHLQRLAQQPASGAGNRRSAYRVALAGAADLFARHSRRGGLFGPLLSDLYFGVRPRPVSELSLTVEARRRGISVAEPVGAMVQWVAPLLYRGFFLTRAMAGMTLWEFLQHDDEPAVRAHVVAQAAHTIEHMHQRGLYHADLNFHNLFVARMGETFSVVLLDLDRARLYPPPLPGALRGKNLARLARSARKLDPTGRYIDNELRQRLHLP